MGMYEAEKYEEMHKEPALLVCVFLFLIITAVGLINLPVSQLTSVYTAAYGDKVWPCTPVAHRHRG